MDSDKLTVTLEERKRLLEAELEKTRRALAGRRAYKELSDGEIRIHDTGTPQHLNEELQLLGFDPSDIDGRSITESEYWGAVFAGSNLPEKIRKAGYDRETLGLFSEAVDEYGIPTFKEAVKVWKNKENDNLTFDYGMIAFTEKNFKDANSLQKLWLSCAYMGQAIRQGALPDEVKKETQRLLRETAAARAKEYDTHEGLTVAVLADNIDGLLNMAVKKVYRTNPPVESSQSFAHLYK